MGGVGINIHKYLGPNDQGVSTDPTLPSMANATEKSIQDLLFLENRDRKYDRSIYNLRGHYTIQDTDFNLSQFGLFVTNDTLFFTFHINDMIEKMGRKIMPGDVLELPHLRDFNPLDPNDEIPIALRKYYVVQETTRAAEGVAPTWWPHLWRAKVQPMVDGQEYRDILNEKLTNEDGDEVGGSTIRDYLSTYNKNVNINDAAIAQAEQDVPLSGYDTTPLYVLPTDVNGNPEVTFAETADSTKITADSTVITSDITRITPQRNLLGYLVGSNAAPNGLPVKALTYFPEVASVGDYVLRLDFFPNRMFRYDGLKWIAIQDNVRAEQLGNNINNQLGTFFNNTNTTTTSSGEVIPQRVSLSQALKIQAD